MFVFRWSMRAKAGTGAERIALLKQNLTGARILIGAWGTPTLGEYVVEQEFESMVDWAKWLPESRKELQDKGFWQKVGELFQDSKVDSYESV